MAGEATFKLTFSKAAEKKILAIGPLAIRRILDELQKEAVKRSPHITGTNRRSIKTDTANNADAPEGTDDNAGKGRIYTTSGYGGHLEIGTGIYGPHKTPIVPKTKKALYWPGAAHPVKSVKGRPATPYIRPSFDAVKRRITSILRGIEKE